MSVGDVDTDVYTLVEIVPREPTQPMLDAVVKYLSNDDAKEVWRCMLEAAPDLTTKRMPWVGLFDAAGPI